ncbi:hypothetical protein F7R91_14840 [Streptomyces luteolifulvus]|uniref:Uncharacterized protein n=1 Tax=Streptomyces luteolifulvus TaxID=2615112 RepID=A0A6H9V309_9ACTN|nr:hypothetical protein [Streptomyces luteolifulvus]KAB1146850.1 hypothetical protein F7R91_14840 [Streptomyces luteolifulvus]
MNAMTADQFATQLRAGGCTVQIDRSLPGVAYLSASKVTRHGVVDMTIVFEGDRFKRAFDVQLGIHRRRWPKFRTMKGVRWFLEIDEPKKAKPRTLRRDSIGYGYETSDGRYEVIPAYTPSCTSLGGRTHRPSYWILKDRQGEHATVQRTLLGDIRDILKELP